MIPNWPLAEVLREFIDFTNAQKGAYSHACAGFGRNEVSVGRQVAIVSKPTGLRVGDDGVPVVMRTSIEDPSRPDVVVHTIRLAADFLNENGAGGRNEQQVCRAIIVFMFAYWDEETRPRCASLLGVPISSLKLPVGGDLRLVRHAILHNGGVLSAKDHKRLEVLGDLFEPDLELHFTHAKMTEVFRQLDKNFSGFAGRLLGLPEPPDGWDSIAQIAIPRQPARTV